MKKIHRVLALLMATLMAFGLMTTAFAAGPTIDSAKKASLSIYKYDITKASEDGVWNAESYVSTGLHDDAVIDKLSKYAIQGVEFTYLKVADIAMNNEVVDNQRQVGVLYGFDTSDRSSAVLSAIGLTAADAHKSENGINYFTSDALNNKLAVALAANATAVKNALEVAVKNGGIAMTETDATGHTSASDMDQGLYLVVETCVPEMVTSTCNPFFVSLPMTTIDGSEWLYDPTVYPKNQTGNPDLEKTVRESKSSTGKNTGSLTDIKDGYDHTATASVGDIVDYTHVYIDEIYLFFASPGVGGKNAINNYSSEFLYKCWKRFRKYYATLTGITQNVEECLLSDTARLMFANSEFLVLLNQAPTDRAELAKLLGASDAQMDYVSDAPAGHGLIKVGSCLVPFINELPRDTELYRLMTTKPGEQNA